MADQTFHLSQRHRVLRLRCVVNNSLYVILICLKMDAFLSNTNALFASSHAHTHIFRSLSFTNSLSILLPPYLHHLLRHSIDAQPRSAAKERENRQTTKYPSRPAGGKGVIGTFGENGVIFEIKEVNQMREFQSNRAFVS